MRCQPSDFGLRPRRDLGGRSPDANDRSACSSSSMRWRNSASLMTSDTERPSAAALMRMALRNASEQSKITRTLSGAMLSSVAPSKPVANRFLRVHQSKSFYARLWLPINMIFPKFPVDTNVPLFYNSRHQTTAPVFSWHLVANGSGRKQTR